MKKHFIKRAAVVSLAVLMTTSMFTACGKKKENPATKVVEYDINEYVTLGAYTGLDATEEIKTVTDADVQAQLDTLVANNTTYNEITDRNTVTGDRITYDSIRSVEGEEDTTNTDVTVELGSGTKGEEFENHLIGIANGSTITFTINEESGTNQVNGDGSEQNVESSTVAATYTITVKKIEEKVVPEVTDTFIAEKTENKYNTIDEYKAGKRTELEESNANSAKSSVQSELLNMIIDNSTINGTPAFVYNMNYNAICQSYAMYASYFGADLDTYMSSYGITYDDIKDNAVEMTKQTLVIEAIVKAADIDITDEQFDEKLQVYVDDYGFESKEAVLKTYSKEELLFDMRRDVAIDYIYENNNITQTYVDSSAE